MLQDNQLVRLQFSFRWFFGEGVDLDTELNAQALNAEASGSNVVAPVIKVRSVRLASPV